MQRLILAFVMLALGRGAVTATIPAAAAATAKNDNNKEANESAPAWKDFIDDFDDDFHDAVPMGKPQVPPRQEEKPPPPPWSGPEPDPKDEVFIMHDEKSNTRSWVPAPAYREWQRWFWFVEYAPEKDGEALVPVQLAMFPRMLWEQVLMLCRTFGHRCELDSATGDLERLKKRCSYCFSERNLPCDHKDPKYCHPVYCDRCASTKADLLVRLTQPHREVTARVKRVSPATAK